MEPRTDDEEGRRVVSEASYQWHSFTCCFHSILAEVVLRYRAGIATSALAGSLWRR